MPQFNQPLVVQKREPKIENSDYNVSDIRIEASNPNTPHPPSTNSETQKVNLTIFITGEVSTSGKKKKKNCNSGKKFQLRCSG